MRLVHVLKAAAEGYGPEKRVILLHGPVGSSKSTIARLLKQGIEPYSRTPDGALYTFDWVNLAGTRHLEERDRPLPEPDERGAAPPHPARVARARRSSELGLSNEQFKVRVDGDLDPGEPLHLQARSCTSTRATGRR